MGGAMHINQERVGEGAQSQTATPRGSRCSMSHGGPTKSSWSRGKELLAAKGPKPGDEGTRDGGCSTGACRGGLGWPARGLKHRDKSAHSESRERG